MRHDLWGCTVEIDRELTEKWYQTAAVWGCECGDCRRFVQLAQGRKLPVPILACLDGLGIPPEKATYVCQIIATDGGDLFQFIYRIAGVILEKGTEGKQPWGEVRFCREPYPYGAPGFPEHHFDLEFWATLPKNSAEE